MKEPECLIQETVVAVQKKLIAIHGGVDGLRDLGQLSATLSRPKQKLTHSDPDIFALAAAYGYGLTQNHCFIDGNKRIGAVAVITFLDINEYEFTASEEDVVITFRALAEGKISEDELASWIRENSSPKRPPPP